ncbi:Methylamine utilisation protein MauE [Pedobacter westerhofensis]|uniref:Methylamine utilisation protein MauE n=1 Tax=Pedobacter westerhofensis TaxID=425512 RepID=A0A521B6S3_9SPHI|nr:MauE/DoxX family redox-associated membrane protein [Pedobacter westerhofensis]SMO42773.1 Methylamine utilisation protein MauE [Pedobacter westerhofensis]
METTLNKLPSSKISSKTKAVIADVAAYSFIILFIYTATSKIQSFESFKLVLSKSVLIGQYSTLVAWAVPSAEIIISLLLIFPLTRKDGLISSLAIMLVFTAYLIYMVNSGTQLICTCGGVLSSLTWQQHIWFNAVFIVLAATGLKFYKSEQL